MRILHLTPGTGTFHCGSCLRDNALVKALRVRGHDAVMMPLYLPLVTDGLSANPEQEVRVGGISLYLTQKMPWFHRMPGFIHRFLNKPQRLRNASQRMGMTSANTLGEMTLGSLLGTEGRQWGEWRKLIAWLKTQPKVDVVALSNSLLTGLAKPITEELGARVVCSLQGEDAFIDTLPEPFAAQCAEALRANTAHIHRYIAPSRYYAKLMQQRLGASDEQMTIVRNGMDLAPFPGALPSPNFPTIGFFARMIPGKGMDLLVDAYLELVKRGNIPRLRLKIGGAATPADDKFIAEQRQKLEAAGLGQRVEFHPNVSFQDKVRFFRDLTVFSVPAVYGEAFGLYVIEAIASGVPVVQPDSGAFSELLEATKGGILCKPNDVTSLADGLETLILDDVQRRQIASQGMALVREEFTAAKMAEAFEAVVKG